MQLFIKFTNFQQRLLLGFGSIIITFCAIFFSHYASYEPLFAFLVIAFQAVALWELYALCAKRGFQALSGIAIGASSLFLFARYLATQYTDLQFVSIVILFLFAITSFATLFKQRETAISTLSTTYFGIAYVTFPLSLLLDINFMQDPATGLTTPFWIFYLLVVTKITDMFAYFIGKKIGKTPFILSISPNKSLEGAFGGLAGAVIVSFIFYYSLPSTSESSLLEFLLLGLVLGVAAEFGDLAESLLKRSAKIKDSNAIPGSIPGFGGILDMADSTLFTSPVLYAYLMAKSLI